MLKSYFKWPYLPRQYSTLTQQMTQKRNDERDLWDKKAAWYQDFEIFSLQGTVTCLSMAFAHQAKSIVEVGCGPGLHSEFIAKNYLQKGSRLVCCDFSSVVMDKVKHKFEHSEFTNDLKNTRVSIDSSTDYVSGGVAKLPTPQND